MRRTIDRGKWFKVTYNIRKDRVVIKWWRWAFQPFKTYRLYKEEQRKDKENDEELNRMLHNVKNYGSFNNIVRNPFLGDN